MVPFGIRYPKIVISLFTDLGIPQGATGRILIVSNTHAFSNGTLSILSNSITSPFVHSKSNNVCNSF